LPPNSAAAGKESERKLIATASTKKIGSGPRTLFRSAVSIFHLLSGVSISDQRSRRQTYGR